MSQGMHFNGCANCLMHGWKQVEDQSMLQRCKRCKLIQYCGKECQAEHWLRVHKKHCRYFADPSKVQRWAHKEGDCAFCLQSDKVGKDNLRRANNPNYECIFKEKFPPQMYHAHPFPVTGQPGDTYEKIIIVLWQLLKFNFLSQPRVTSDYREDMVKVFVELKRIRLGIWRARKISPQSEYLSLEFLSPLSLLDLLQKAERSFLEDPFQLWETILLVEDLLKNVDLLQKLDILQNPLADMLTDLHAVMSKGLSNSAKFLAMADQIIEALAAQVVPLRDVLRIICGGSLEKRCSFCSKKIIVTNVSSITEGSGVFFHCLSMETYLCDSNNCREKAHQDYQDYVRFGVAVITAVQKQGRIQCDFCSKLPPSKDVHRCSRCLTVMYCSTACRDQDWNIHKDICKEDAEERKKKFGSSGRKKEAMDALDQVKKSTEQSDSMFFQEAGEVVEKFKAKNIPKKAQK